MKKYKMNEMMKTEYTKVTWRYIGSADTVEKCKAKFNDYFDMYKRASEKGEEVGFKITDTETNEVVFEYLF